jgi:hypothetical protein
MIDSLHHILIMEFKFFFLQTSMCRMQKHAFAYYWEKVQYSNDHATQCGAHAHRSICVSNVGGEPPVSLIININRVYFT